MSPDQFLARMKKGVIAPAYLFLGPEAYDRRRCREALLGAMLAPEEREEGLSQYDLRETSLPDVVDDARSLSLFAARRVIVVANAPAALSFLVEALGADVARIDIEIEKLRLYVGSERTITLEDISKLVPEARASTIFALVSALGRRDRRQSLQILDTLTRDGEYLPLALSFLSAQFRMALVSKESALRGPQQIQSYFSALGVPVWGSRAEQIQQTVAKFSKEQLELGLKLIFDADRDMRSTRPDDRIVMEKFIFEVTR